MKILHVERSYSEDSSCGEKVMVKILGVGVDIEYEIDHLCAK